MSLIDGGGACVVHCWIFFNDEQLNYVFLGSCWLYRAFVDCLTQSKTGRNEVEMSGSSTMIVSMLEHSPIVTKKREIWSTGCAGNGS